MCKYISVIILSLCSYYAIAQDIEVKKFEPMAKDQTAVLNPRKGYQWNCVWISEGLIKGRLEGCKNGF